MRGEPNAKKEAYTKNRRTRLEAMPIFSPNQAQAPKAPVSIRCLILYSMVVVLKVVRFTNISFFISFQNPETNTTFQTAFIAAIMFF
jgi:hypothetical protein